VKSPFFLKFVRPFIRRKFKKTFENVRLLGEARLLERLAEGPLVIAANHVTFWDALLLIFLDERWGGGGHALMDAVNLAELPFFGRVGAIPIHRGHPKKGLQDLKSSLRLLQRAGDYVVIFPQGHERPLVRPLSYHEGVAWLAKSGGVPIVPVAVRYDFGLTERPFVHAAIGEPLQHSAELLAQLEEATLGLSGLVDEELIRINRGLSGLQFQDAWARPARTDRPWAAILLAKLFSWGNR
jgi:1-acyl-sn-glycerol-3-phosphate acyltransferase